MPDPPARPAARPRARPPALDPPMVPFALAGTGVWAVVGVALLLAGAPAGWLWTCLAGVLLGLVMLPILVVHDRRRPSRPDRSRRDPGR